MHDLHPTSPPPSHGLRHVEIGVGDLERSLAFYRDLLGFPVRARRGAGEAWLDCGTALLRLVATGPGDPPSETGDDRTRGFRHIGHKVADVDAWVRRLRDAGVPIAVGPLDAAGGVRLAFFHDPDGTYLEIVEGVVDYRPVWSPELAEREAAELREWRGSIRFDHVALTVADLDAALALYRDTLGFAVIGQLDRSAEDARGFTITYLRAGAGVLELFSFSVPTLPAPGRPDPTAPGFHAVGVAVDGDTKATLARSAEPIEAPAQAGDAAPLLVPDHVALRPVTP